MGNTRRVVRFPRQEIAVRTGLRVAALISAVGLGFLAIGVLIFVSETTTRGQIQGLVAVCVSVLVLAFLPWALSRTFGWSHPFVLYGDPVSKVTVARTWWGRTSLKRGARSRIVVRIGVVDRNSARQVATPYGAAEPAHLSLTIEAWANNVRIAANGVPVVASGFDWMSWCVFELGDAPWVSVEPLITRDGKYVNLKRY